jgi:hypothetical protein
MRVGSLVELVDDDWDIEDKMCNEQCGVVYPVKNKIYTIRDIDNGIRLEEILNPVLEYADGWAECRFAIERFRELMPPTSIELESILENELQEV